MILGYFLNLLSLVFWVVAVYLSGYALSELGRLITLPGEAWWLKAVYGLGIAIVVTIWVLLIGNKLKERGWFKKKFQTSPTRELIDNW